MTVGQGGAWPSDLVYGKTIRTVASHGYIVVAAQVEGMQGKDGTQVARGVEQVISNSKWSRYASRSAVGNMGHSMGGGATLYAGKLLSKAEEKLLFVRYRALQARPHQTLQLCIYQGPVTQWTLIGLATEIVQVPRCSLK